MVQVVRFGALENNKRREAGVQLAGWCTGSYDVDHNKSYVLGHGRW
jgi:hypothetical protein